MALTTSTITDEAYIDSLITKVLIYNKQLYVYHRNNVNGEYNPCNMQFIEGIGIPYEIVDLEYPDADLCETNEESKSFVANKPITVNVDNIAEYTRMVNMDIVRAIDGKTYIYSSEKGKLLQIRPKVLNDSVFFYSEWSKDSIVAKDEVVYYGGYYFKALIDTSSEPVANSTEWRMVTPFDAVMSKCYDPTLNRGVITPWVIDYSLWEDGILETNPPAIIDYEDGVITSNPPAIIDYEDGVITSNPPILIDYEDGVITTSTLLPIDYEDGVITSNTPTLVTYEDGVITSNTPILVTYEDGVITSNTPTLIDYEDGIINLPSSSQQTNFETAILNQANNTVNNTINNGTINLPSSSQQTNFETAILNPAQ